MGAYAILNNIANYIQLRKYQIHCHKKPTRNYTPYGMNSGANANSESIMPLTIKNSSTAMVASHSIRSFFTQLKETLPAAFGHMLITAYEQKKLMFKSNQELIRKTSL